MNEGGNLISTSPGDEEWPDQDAEIRERKRIWANNHKDTRLETTKKWIQDNPLKRQQHRIRYVRKARSSAYLTKPFVAIDSEGQDVLGNPIYRDETPYEDHKIFMWGAASIDQTRAPEWLIHPETTDADKRELDPVDVLEWLVGLPEKYGDANFVMYSFSYDVIHILKHLRFEKAWEIFKGEKYTLEKSKRRKLRNGQTFCGGRFDHFVMSFKNRKQLDIWKLRDPDKPYLRDDNDEYALDIEGRKKLDTIAHITISDAYPSFQQGFAKAAKLLVKLGKAKKEDFEFLEAMKAKRGQFVVEPIEVIKRYTTFELRWLAELMTEMRSILHGIKLTSAPDMKPIHIKDWYGPGPIARALLNNLEIINKHYGGFIHSEKPGPLQIAAHHAFAAGRIELLKMGHAPYLELHSYDIASAYPHALSLLPSLKGEGRWKHKDSFAFNNLAELKAIIESASPVSMFYLKYEFPLYEKYAVEIYNRVYIPWYPLFFRSARGAIYFPRRGEGWYMRDEALAAVKWLERFVPVERWRDGSPVTKQWELKRVSFEVKQSWTFTPLDPDERPFAFQEELYKQRVQYKRAVPYDAREKFYKLPLNSLYGKMAQRVGGMLTSSGFKPPPTANPYYAAAITANCRRRLVEAALTNPHSVVAFMTDGIVTDKPLDLPNMVIEGSDSSLGDWEYSPVEGGTFLHAGVYNMRKAGENLTKTRGMDPKRVSADQDAGELLKRMAVEEMSREYDPDIGYGIILKIRDLVTIGQALMASEHNRELWNRGYAGRWAPPIDNPNALKRIISLTKLGVKRSWIEGREDDWQTRRRPDGTLRLANRTVTLVPTIPANNPEPPGTISAMYKPEWVDPEMGEEIDEAEEQEAIEDEFN